MLFFFKKYSTVLLSINKFSIDAGYQNLRKSRALNLAKFASARWLCAAAAVVEPETDGRTPKPCEVVDAGFRMGRSSDKRGTAFGSSRAGVNLFADADQLIAERNKLIQEIAIELANGRQVNDQILIEAQQHWKERFAATAIRGVISE